MRIRRLLLLTLQIHDVYTFTSKIRVERWRGPIVRKEIDSESVNVVQRLVSLSQRKPLFAFKPSDMFLEGPPIETKPVYEDIHGPLGQGLDRIFLRVFRTKMANLVGKEMDSSLPADDYQGLMELTSNMNKKYSQTECQVLSQMVLCSLFPDLILNNFGWMFAKPFPEFSGKMNAWATFYAGVWLMGEVEINDCEIDGEGNNEDGEVTIGKNQGLLVKRCRFLEESGCASVCVNSCKIPTQNFFMENMGLPLTMEPDYETGECQFSFGLTPSLEQELAAINTPCLARCPSSMASKRKHLSKSASAIESQEKMKIESSDNRCYMMEDPKSGVTGNTSID